MSYYNSYLNTSNSFDLNKFINFDWHKFNDFDWNKLFGKSHGGCECAYKPKPKCPEPEDGLIQYTTGDAILAGGPNADADAWLNDGNVSVTGYDYHGNLAEVLLTNNKGIAVETTELPGGSGPDEQLNHFIAGTFGNDTPAGSEKLVLDFGQTVDEATAVVSNLIGESGHETDTGEMGQWRAYNDCNGDGVLEEHEIVGEGIFASVDEGVILPDGAIPVTETIDGTGTELREVYINPDELFTHLEFSALAYPELEDENATPQDDGTGAFDSSDYFLQSVEYVPAIAELHDEGIDGKVKIKEWCCHTKVKACVDDILDAQCTDYIVHNTNLTGRNVDLVRNFDIENDILTITGIEEIKWMKDVKVNIKNDDVPGKIEALMIKVEKGDYIFLEGVSREEVTILNEDPGDEMIQIVGVNDLPAEEALEIV